MLDRPTPAASMDRRTLLEGIRDRAPEADRGEASLRADIDALADAGWLVAPLPQSLGGHGWGCEALGRTGLFEALTALGHANLSVARLYEGHVNAIKLVHVHGTKSQMGRVAEQVQQGHLLGVWGAEGEPGTSLVQEGDETQLSGSKRFASGLGLVHPAIVPVSTPDGPQLVLASTNDAGSADASVWRVGGMRATESGTYRFDNVAAVPVGKPADYLKEPWFEGGVWRYCAAHLGAAQALHDAMVNQLTRTNRHDDPHQKARIARSAIACETARLWIKSAADKVETVDTTQGDEAAAYALLAREATETACVDVMTIVDRALGMAGFATDSPVERIRRDLGLFLRQANPDGKLAKATTTLLDAGGRADML